MRKCLLVEVCASLVFDAHWSVEKGKLNMSKSNLLLDPKNEIKHFVKCVQIRSMITKTV